MTIRALEDSQIKLPPGVTLTPEQMATVAPLVPTLTSWMRTVRGGVLTGAFYIERNLDVTIEAYFLGGEAGGGTRADLFAELVLGSFNFERRIQVALAIAEALGLEGRNALQRDLREVKTLRNAMAHHPAWFEPSFRDDRLVGLKSMITIGKQVKLFSPQAVEGFNELITRSIDATKTLADLALTRKE